MSVKPMLAQSPAKDAEGQPIVPLPTIIQPKLDGVRALVLNGRVYSRSLKLIPNAEVQTALGRPAFEGLDGELVVGPPNAENVYNRTVSFVMSESKTGEPWAFVVFDKFDLPAAPYFTRYHDALAATEEAGDPRITMIAGVRVETQDELERVEAHLIEQGYEGAIARYEAPYKYGRSGKKGPLLKIKRFTDFEARVVGVYEEEHNGNVAQRNALGRTERSTAKAGKTGKGTLGGLVLVALNGPFEGVEFRCGTGFTAAMRAELWAESRNLIADVPGVERMGLNGRIAKVKFFVPGSKDKPRHPVFLGWRDERDMGDPS